MMSSERIQALESTVEALEHRVRSLEASFLPPTVQEGAIESIAARAGVDMRDVLGRGRTQRVRRARAAMVHYLRRERMSFPDIAKALGGRHHTTVWQIERNTIADPAVFALLRGAL